MSGNHDVLGAWVIGGAVVAMCILVPLAHWIDRRHTRLQQQARRPGLWLERDEADR